MIAFILYLIFGVACLLILVWATRAVINEVDDDASD
jgi:hypothetical protein